MANAQNDGSSTESDNELFQQIEMQQKHGTEGERVDPVIPNNINIASNSQPISRHTGNPSFNSKYSQISQSSQANVISNIPIVPASNTTNITTKIYLIVGWRILIHLLILYAVIMSTYLFLIKTENSCDCNGITSSQQSNIDDLTTESPTQSPLESTPEPSKFQTLLPSPYDSALYIMITQNRR